MKKIIVLLLLMLGSFYLQAYDEEDSIDSLGYINTIDSYILDLNVSSPVNSYIPAINFKTGILLPMEITLGLNGYFFNGLEKTEDFTNESYTSDTDGKPDYLSKKSRSDKFKMEIIDNNLTAYLGYKLLHNLSLNFMLGGGIYIPEYEVINEEYKFNYNADGSYKILSPGTDDHKVNSLEKITGYGNLKFGIGLNMEKEFFQTEIINSVIMTESFSFDINGKGKPENLIVLGNTGIISSGFDGDNSDYYNERQYFIDASKSKSHKIIDNETFEYFKFNNEGYFEIALNLSDYFINLAFLNRLRLNLGLGYSLGITAYLKSKDITDIFYDSDVLGHQSDDYNTMITDYQFGNHLEIGALLPISIDLRPIKNVQIKLGYTLDFTTTFIDYTAQYSENHKQLGAEQSFTDPIVKVSSQGYNIDHEIAVRFRYEFPKIVRLSMGAYYYIEHTINNNKISIEDNKRKWEEGNTTAGPYSDIIDATNFLSTDMSSPLNSSKIIQSISPILELNFEIVKDFSTLTVGWQPNLTWDYNNPTNEDVIASNILNLANWEISNVIHFSPENMKKFNAGTMKNRRIDTVEQLVILHTNDTHGHPVAFDNYPAKNIGGLPARSTYVDSIRKSYSNVLVLDAGDYNTGRPESNFFYAEPDIIGYNHIGYDAVAIGNHEFDVPREILMKQMKQAKFPFLSANIKTQDGKYLAKPYIIKKYRNIKVGIFGLTTVETQQQGNKDNFTDLIFEDEVETAKEMVSLLKDKVDIIIALSHLGLYDDKNRGSKRVALNVEGIDLIIDGHTHTQMYEPEVVNGTPIVQSWKWGMGVGKAIFTMKNGEIANFNWNLDPINLQEVKLTDDWKKEVSYITEKIEEDKKLSFKLDNYMYEVDKILSEVIGKSSGTYYSANIRKKSQPLGDLVADSMLWYTEEFDVDFAIQNSGGVRADIPSGSITKKIIYEVLPFDNTVVIATLKGEDVIKLFEYLGTINSGEGAFPQVSDGVSFVLDHSNRISSDITINGEPLDPAKDYKIATNSFMADGGDGYVILKNATDLYDTSTYQNEVLIEYIKSKESSIFPADNQRIISNK